MGTNFFYYLETDTCHKCGHTKEPKHIGKSSAGWAFSLHMYPNEDINSLYDWLSILSTDEGFIKSEYGEVFTVKQLLRRIMHRHNNAAPLFRHPGVTGGPTWDHLEGDFS